MNKIELIFKQADEDIDAIAGTTVSEAMRIDFISQIKYDAIKQATQIIATLHGTPSLDIHAKYDTFAEIFLNRIKAGVVQIGRADIPLKAKARKPNKLHDSIYEYLLSQDAYFDTARNEILGFVRAADIARAMNLDIKYIYAAMNTLKKEKIVDSHLKKGYYLI